MCHGSQIWSLTRNFYNFNKEFWNDKTKPSSVKKYEPPKIFLAMFFATPVKKYHFI